ncbi:MAG TPA: hydrogenase formation protein HypD [Thermodesulfovibrionales bacterium]|jgi:hydrogenase expression/formation protein HypD|nr:hydrogenase formation protein HypD [Thermodesulfovibrionales bacterium]
MKTMIAGIRRMTERIGRPVKLMEVCGTHTVAIFRHGIRSVIPDEISLLSGPGCPVCVTSIRDVDSAIAISKIDKVVLMTFGDMMRVPGGRQTLDDVRAEGTDIRIVYSPMDALKFAMEEKDKEIVFFATGFETTSPVIAGTLAEAEMSEVGNFYIYSAHKLVPPALKALLDSADVMVDGFILPGHVSTIIGKHPYEFLASQYGIPSVITGFGAEDIITGIYLLIKQLVEKRAEVEIQYKTVVREEGNPKAVAMISTYFEPADAHWRGIGLIPGSGLKLRDEFVRFDAIKKFHPEVPFYPEPSACSCGDVLRGVKVPLDCPLFATACTPENPVGACMVSTEGSCAAYYKYGAHYG